MPCSTDDTLLAQMAANTYPMYPMAQAARPATAPQAPYEQKPAPYVPSAVPAYGGQPQYAPPMGYAPAYDPYAAAAAAYFIRTPVDGQWTNGFFALSSSTPVSTS